MHEVLQADKRQLEARREPFLRKKKRLEIFRTSSEDFEDESTGNLLAIRALHEKHEARVKEIEAKHERKVRELEEEVARLSGLVTATSAQGDTPPLLGDTSPLRAAAPSATRRISRTVVSTCPTTS